ncbi:MAG: PhoX family protein [Shimia sp.]
MKTNDDPTGTKVIASINNCAGGMTLWGANLMAEENFHGSLWIDNVDAEGKAVMDSGNPKSTSYGRYGSPGRWHAWGTVYDRFSTDKEPKMPNTYGFVVEVDPMNPDAARIKHTALGRFRHEGAETMVAADGRLVVYSSENNRFDYQCKWVSADPVTEENAVFNSSLLSGGTLYVARFHDDGTINWLPLVHGEGTLMAENGINSQAEIAIDADGRLWTSTDQGGNWGKTGKSDGLYALETEGELRGHSKMFFRCPAGGQLCGPCFT